MGMLEQGNIDLNNRPHVKNPDGSVSTVRSMGVNIDGQEVLLPTVSEDGRVMSNKEAVGQYFKTGKHLGRFDSQQSANAYAQMLHESQAKNILSSDIKNKNGGNMNYNQYDIRERPTFYKEKPIFGEDFNSTYTSNRPERIYPESYSTATNIEENVSSGIGEIARKGLTSNADYKPNDNYTIPKDQPSGESFQGRPLGYSGKNIDPNTPFSANINQLFENPIPDEIRADKENMYRQTGADYGKRIPDISGRSLSLEEYFRPYSQNPVSSYKTEDAFGTPLGWDANSKTMTYKEYQDSLSRPTVTSDQPDQIVDMIRGTNRQSIVFNPTKDKYPVDEGWRPYDPFGTVVKDLNPEEEKYWNTARMGFAEKEAERQNKSNIAIIAGQSRENVAKTRNEGKENIFGDVNAYLDEEARNKNKALSSAPSNIPDFDEYLQQIKNNPNTSNVDFNNQEIRNMIYKKWKIARGIK